jgi:hypothetical protein
MILTSLCCVQFVIYLLLTNCKTMIITRFSTDRIQKNCFPNVTFSKQFASNNSIPLSATSGVPRNFVSGGEGSTNSVEDREQNGDLGAVAP